MEDDLRGSHWWLLHEVGSPDFENLVSVVSASDWAVFQGRDDDPDAEPPVALKLARSSDGRMICTAMIVGLNEAYPVVIDGRGGYQATPVEVTSRALRKIPVAELIGRAMRSADAPGWGDLVKRRVPKVRAVQRSPGPKGHPDEHFREVADAYREALLAEPRRPMAWMQRHYHADRTTIARWVKRARDMGYLGEADPGKAGDRRRDEDS